MLQNWKTAMCFQADSGFFIFVMPHELVSRTPKERFYNGLIGAYHYLGYGQRDRSIPADNNYSERELRKLVITRKISYG